MEVTNEEQARAIGRVLSNTTKLRMLMALATSPLPKGKLSEKLNIAWSTAWLYLGELRDAGLVEEYFFADGTKQMMMVKLKERVIHINLDKVNEKRARTS